MSTRADRLRQAREAKGLTTADVLERWSKVRERIPVELGRLPLCWLAETYGVTERWLLTGEEPRLRVPAEAAP